MRVLLRISVRSAAPLLAAVSLIGGCGGSGSGTHTQARAQFGASLNRICAAGDAEYPQTAPRTLVDLIHEMQRAASDNGLQLREARRLVAPPGLRMTFADYLKISREQQDLIEDMLSSAKQNQVQVVFLLNVQLERLDKPNNTAARQLGAPACETQAAPSPSQTKTTPGLAA